VPDPAGDAALAEQVAQIIADNKNAPELVLNAINQVKDLKASGTGKGVLGLGAEETSRVMEVLKELKTTIRVVGPVTQPRLVFDTKGLTKEFQDALVAAGKQKLQEEVGKQIEKQLGDKVPTELKDTLQGKSKDIVEGLGGLLGGKKKDDEKK
jgi:hypothetical protein